MDFFTLDFRGAVLALLMGAALYLFGLGIGYYFVGVMLLFLLLSAIVTNIRLKHKRHMGIEQGTRGVMNVVANGLMPLIMGAVHFVFVRSGMYSLAVLAVIGFVASVAAVTADKFSSEIGVLGGKPVQIFTFKRVRQGVSGAVSPLGLIVGIAAASLIAATLLIVFPHVVSAYGAAGAARGGLSQGLRDVNLGNAILSVAIGGFVGDIVDSMLGYYEEMGIGNKFSSNFVCSVAGSVVGMAVFALA